ncbi:MAG: DUF2071 domain-containing protein [Balneolaceae bacterium]
MSHPALEKQSHRPWPVPQNAWKGRQTWRDLLFAHWPVPAEKLRRLVPEPLTIQEHDGTSWVGIVPFRMSDAMVRNLPNLPGLSAFPELNLRLYVDYKGKPGVWFLSLDCTNPLAVWGARRFFHLPYFKAKMNVKNRSGHIHYSSSRKKFSMQVDFESVYGPVSNPFHAKPGTLEHFLTERYCLYSQSPDGDIYRVEIHHKPWTLQKAEASFSTNLTEPFGFQLPETQPLLHFSPIQKVINWLPEKVNA